MSASSFSIRWLACLGILLIVFILMACSGGETSTPGSTAAPTDTPVPTNTPTPTLIPASPTPAPTDTPTPTIVAAPAPSPVPTAAPSPTATPVQPTATPTPDITQAPSEPGPGLTGEQMAAIMLTQEDIDTEFPSLEFDPDTSGFADNADAAEDTFDPDDIEADITAAGRITATSTSLPIFRAYSAGAGRDP